IHWQELIVILLIVLVLFGPKRLPEIGSSLGKGIRGFKESVSGMVSDDKPTAATLTAASTSSTTTEPAVPVPVEVVVDTDEPHDSAR
ncbi:MAG: Sec-independent protein translocase protein TatA, partial [Thermoleophilia bacterium]|nr:Sec-independent protein translocase protein TatA [Thermoleophilia bacterium]